VGRVDSWIVSLKQRRKQVTLVLAALRLRSTLALA
jgi:hypothetical protein